jgi:Phosphotransferase enzyme family
MPDFVLGHTSEWYAHFRRRGYAAEPLAAGVEGAVYDLGGGLVAKVWRERGAAELSLMQAFYADVAAGGLPFATPEIVELERVGGTTVSYEVKLPGTALQRQLGHDDREIGPAAAQCVLGVLTALRAVRATGSMRQLAVLDEDRSLRSPGDTFPAALLGLLGRRVARFGPVLRDRLPDFGRRYGALRDRLATLAADQDAVIHGDLFGGNILVNERTRPLAVLDFGFLTTAGDPRLDAAITASIMNMYGPHAPRITSDITAMFAAELGYPAEVLLTYQAAYAVATSNAFTGDGSDGHFAWCVDQLRRADIAAAIGL